MNVRWVVQYLGIAFGCLIPVLQAIWVCNDKKTIESITLLPAINHQLRQWGYTLLNKPHKLFWDVLGSNSGPCCEFISGETWVGFRITKQFFAKFYLVGLDAYGNRYFVRTEAYEEEYDFTSCKNWFTALLEYLRPGNVAPLVSLPLSARPTSYAGLNI